MLPVALSVLVAATDTVLNTTPNDTGNYGHYHHLTVRTFSSHTIPVSTHMAVGKLVVTDHESNGGDGDRRREELHLIPLSRITQMRPSFTHVDDAMSNTTSTTDDELKRERAEAAKMDRKPVGFQKKESERAALARKSSFAYKKSSEDEEMWQPLQVHLVKSVESREALLKVFCPHPEQSLLTVSGKNEVNSGKNEANMNKNLRAWNGSYVQSLNYLPLVQKKYAGEEPTDLTSVVTKLVGLMQQGWPIPYSLLRKQYTPSLVSDQTLFVALSSCAVNVRGNFVLQSRLLPLHPAVANARTFILFLLQTMEVVHRSRLDYVYNGDAEVTEEVILMLLEQVAQKSPMGWKLKVDDDINFAKKYPDTMLTYLQFWASQLRRFGPLLERYRADILRAG